MRSKVGSWYSAKMELTFLWVIATSVSLGALLGCTKPQVIPAKAIDGIWTTSSPVIFYNKTDSCGSYQRYVSIPVALSLNITFMSDNLVDVIFTPTSIGNFTRLDTTCKVSDTITFTRNLRGIVNQTDLVLEEVRQQYDSAGMPDGILYVEVGTFTLNDKNTMTGTLMDKSCTTFCTGYETDPDLCILTRQN